MKRLIFVIALICMGVSAFAESPADKLSKEEKRAQRDSIKAAQMIGAHRKGNTIRLDSTVLNSEQRYMLLSDIDALDYNPEWAKLKSQRNWGKTLIIGGSCFAVVGVGALGYAIVETLAGLFVAIFSFGYAEKDIDILMTRAAWGLGIGVVSGGIGVAGIASGIPILKKANKRMNQICDGYNNTVHRVEKELIFGQTSSGVGLAFNF